ncbi:hypothetical protein LTS18_003926 [Coniosporium uncinatum]|uniref:Uncharacterized protein n=1 Tax=Coniosporium uncinatum TaxID=93489 RepID=A0ACC3D6D9_9PEZI|nr:hypothetical protein LTS18_003926 [Coniosporium uncinatum]
MRLPLRILTHNIRYATSSPSTNEKPWTDRFPHIVNQLMYHTRLSNGRNTGHVIDAENSDFGHDTAAASFISLQEVLHGQLNDILSSLNDIPRSEHPGTLPDAPFWAHIGVAREDGKKKGEYSPILYPVRIFNLLHFENIWLSPTPQKPSKGWDAGSERILTTGVFEHKASKQRIAVFNTHLDNAGSEARAKSVEIILNFIEQIRTQWAPKYETGSHEPSSGCHKLNYILTGDFNSFPTQEAYMAIAASDTMVDTYEAIPKFHRYGDEITFTGFQPDTDVDKDEIGRIDFVFFGPKESVSGQRQTPQSETAWQIEGYTVLPNVGDDGVFSSDHRAVVADAMLRL